MNNLFYRKNLLSVPEEVLPVASPEEGSSGRTNCSTVRSSFGSFSERMFFRMNKLFYWKNLLPVAFSEEGSSDRTTGKTFFRKKKSFFLI